MQCLVVAHAGNMLVGKQSTLQRLLFDPLDVNAAAVIVDLDVDLAALVIGAHFQAAFLRLAASHANIRLFNAVIRRVADDVSEWILDSLDDGLVEFGFLAFHLDSNLLSAGRCEITYHARQFAPDIADGLHTCLHHAALQFGGDEIQPL